MSKESRRKISKLFLSRLKLLPIIIFFDYGPVNSRLIEYQFDINHQTFFLKPFYYRKTQFFKCLFIYGQNRSTENRQNR
jgi:hypothetical protein